MSKQITYMGREWVPARELQPCSNCTHYNGESQCSMKRNCTPEASYCSEFINAYCLQCNELVVDGADYCDSCLKIKQKA